MNASNFNPSNELVGVLNNSDLDLVFLSGNNVLYTSEVDDAWYSAHRYIGDAHSPTFNGVMKAYISDEPASPLGCSSHYEICNPESSAEQGCPVSGGVQDLLYPNLPEENKAFSIAPWITNQFSELTSTITSLSITSLTSRYGLNLGVQSSIPNNQWQSEVENWHNIGLTSLQNVINTAIGPGDSDILKYFWKPPKSDLQKYFCKNQVCGDSFAPLFYALRVPVY